MSMVWWFPPQLCSSNMVSEHFDWTTFDPWLGLPPPHPLSLLSPISSPRNSQMIITYLGKSKSLHISKAKNFTPMLMDLSPLNLNFSLTPQIAFPNPTQNLSYGRWWINLFQASSSHLPVTQFLDTFFLLPQLVTYGPRLHQCMCLTHKRRSFNSDFSSLTSTRVINVSLITLGRFILWSTH